MAFTSDIGGLAVIGDDNYSDYVSIPDGKSKGYSGRDWTAHPFGSSRFMQRWDKPLIPRSEWKERIEERERKKCRLVDIHRHYKIPILDQNGTNYCWCFGVVGSMMLARAVAGLPTVHLSAASAAAKIKNGRNEGGWGGEAIEGIAKYGVSSVKYWPEASRDIAKYNTHEQQLDAEKNKVFEFYELPPKNFDVVVTCMLLGMPVPVGLMWWSHLVYLMDPVVLPDGGFGALAVNSWDDTWENGGMAVLKESKATPDECNAVRAVTTGMAA